MAERLQKAGKVEKAEEAEEKAKKEAEEKAKKEAEEKARVGAGVGVCSTIPSQKTKWQKPE